MGKKWTMLKILRHTRHDYLNELQLIKGYLQLNNHERAIEIVDNIVHTYENEAKLTNLEMPELASKLITFNWEQHHFTLNYILQNADPSSFTNEEKITAWLAAFFSLLNKAVDKLHNNELIITISTKNNLGRFTFKFSGKIKENGLIDNFLLQSEEIETVIHQVNKTDLLFDVYF